LTSPIEHLQLRIQINSAVICELPTYLTSVTNSSKMVITDSTLDD